MTRMAGRLRPRVAIAFPLLLSLGLGLGLDVAAPQIAAAQDRAAGSRARDGSDCAPAFLDPRRSERICVPRIDDAAARDRRDAEICRAIAHFARRDGLPPDFFARLIWRESLFEPYAVSPAGALGIAQFIPATARRRGLADPFNPAEALGASSAYLAALRGRFGNLGMAAVAYNAGEAAAEGVQAGRRGAPGETRAYVFAITGLSVEDWRNGAPRPEVDYALAKADGSTPSAAPAPFLAACLTLAATRRAPPMARGGDWRPFGAMIAAHRDRGVALRMYRRAERLHPGVFSGVEPLLLRRRLPGRGRRALTAAMIGADTRAEAAEICRGLTRAGAPCVVVRN